MKTVLLSLLCMSIIVFSIAQNVGIGTNTPQGRLNIKGNADTSQLVIDAGASQTNSHPLIRIRNASGTDIMHIHSDDPSNTFIGVYAGRVNTTITGNGMFNTFTGAKAGYSNTAGGYNTAYGYDALYTNATGGYNTAGGYAALQNNISNFNTAFGLQALFNNVSGSANTAIGYSAEVDLTGSTHNTIVGATAHILGNNDVVVGYGAYTNVDNLALLGNITTLACGGYANWSNFSDGRCKKDIAEDVKGLDFIMRLHPVTYHMDVMALYKLWGESPYGKNVSPASPDEKTQIDAAIKTKEAVHMTGFIAQEVEQAANASGYDFDGIIKPAHSKDHYRLAYGEFVVPLVKAMQEQEKIIEDQKAVIDKQQQLIDQIQQRLSILESKVK